jgi:hypothetical protein
MRYGRGGRAVEGTGLENRQRRKSLVGSNPTPSASAQCQNPTAAVANKLWDSAMAGNVTAMIFWLKAQAGWRDSVQIDISGEIGTPDQSADREKQLAIIRAMTPEERNEYLDLVRKAQARTR